MSEKSGLSGLLNLPLELRFIIFDGLEGIDLRRLRITCKQLCEEVDEDVFTRRYIAINSEDWLKRIEFPYIIEDNGPSIHMQSRPRFKYLKEDIYSKPTYKVTSTLAGTFLPWTPNNQTDDWPLPADLMYLKRLQNLAIEGKCLDCWLRVVGLTSSGVSINATFREKTLNQVSTFLRRVFPSLKQVAVDCIGAAEIFALDDGCFTLKTTTTEWEWSDCASIPFLGGPLATIFDWNRFNRLLHWFRRRHVELDEDRKYAPGRVSVIQVEEPKKWTAFLAPVVDKCYTRCYNMLRRTDITIVLSEIQEQLEDCCFLPKSGGWLDRAFRTPRGESKYRQHRNDRIENVSTASEILAMVANRELGVEPCRKSRYEWSESEDRWKVIATKTTIRQERLALEPSLPIPRRIWEGW